MNSDGFSALGPMDDDNRWFFMPGGAAPGTSLSKKDAETLIAKSTGIDLSYDVISADSWTASALLRSEEHTSELQSIMSMSYAVLCLKKKRKRHRQNHNSRRDYRVTT